MHTHTHTPYTAENPTYAPVAAKLQFRWPASPSSRSSHNDEDEDGAQGFVYWESAEVPVAQRMTVGL